MPDENEKKRYPDARAKYVISEYIKEKWDYIQTTRPTYEDFAASADAELASKGLNCGVSKSTIMTLVQAMGRKWHRGRSITPKTGNATQTDAAVVAILARLDSLEKWAAEASKVAPYLPKPKAVTQ